MLFELFSMVGLVMLIATDNNNVKYAGCFFLASGIYPNVPQGVAWNGNNIGGSLKRGVGIASKHPPPPKKKQGTLYNMHCICFLEPM